MFSKVLFLAYKKVQESGIGGGSIGANNSDSSPLRLYLKDCLERAMASTV